jgi:hypothetical protein
MTQPVATARPLLTVHQGTGPVLVTAIHAGHEIRPELQHIMKLDEATRLREEDPFTDAWICMADNYIVPQRSRFEVDLNRPRDQAVYRSAEDAWGLDIWKTPPTKAMVERSLEEYDMFYQQFGSLLDEMLGRHERLVIYDLHTYNHRRAGPDAPPADPAENPEVNVGTGTMDRVYWAPVVEIFIDQLKAFDYLGRHLDVRENIKFRGRAFARWVHDRYPQSVCVLSIEIKKFFMDEWSGMGDPVKIQALRQALGGTIPGVVRALRNL